MGACCRAVSRPRDSRRSLSAAGRFPKPDAGSCERVARYGDLSHPLSEPLESDFCVVPLLVADSQRGLFLGMRGRRRTRGYHLLRITVRPVQSGVAAGLLSGLTAQKVQKIVWSMIRRPGAGVVRAVGRVMVSVLSVLAISSGAFPDALTVCLRSEAKRNSSSRPRGPAPFALTTPANFISACRREWAELDDAARG